MKILGNIRLAAITLITVASVAGSIVIQSPALATTDVSQPILQALTRLIQVEKVADDSYTHFLSTTGEKRFQTVLNQEGIHEQKLALVLAINGIANPIAALKPGEFTDPTLKTLYTNTITQGSASKRAALTTAVKLETADIQEINDILAMKPPAFIAKLLKDMRAQSVRHVQIFSK